MGLLAEHFRSYHVDHSDVIGTDRDLEFYDNDVCSSDSELDDLVESPSASDGRHIKPVV